MPLSVRLLGDKDQLMESVNYPYAAQRQLNRPSMTHRSPQVFGLRLCSARQAGLPAWFSGLSAMDWIVMRLQEAVFSLIIEVIAFCSILRQGFACGSGFTKATFYWAEEMDHGNSPEVVSSPAIQHGRRIIMRDEEREATSCN
jgi:hypothetical protein